MKKYLSPMLVAVVLAISVSETRADWQVWTMTETARVLRDVPVGHGTAVKLTAARNEWESFQVLKDEVEF